MVNVNLGDVQGRATVVGSASISGVIISLNSSLDANTCVETVLSLISDHWDWLKEKESK